MLPADAVLEEMTLSRIISSGHSRVPIHQPGSRSVEFVHTATLKQYALPVCMHCHLRHDVQYRSLPCICLSVSMVLAYDACCNADLWLNSSILATTCTDDKPQA